MLSVSAWYLLKKRHLDLARSNFTLALPFFIVLTISNVVLFGANQAIEVTHEQPLKLASMEGLWQDDLRAAVPVRLGRRRDPDDDSASRSRACSASWPTSTRRPMSPGINDFPGRPRRRSPSCSRSIT